MNNLNQIEKKKQQTTTLSIISIIITLIILLIVFYFLQNVNDLVYDSNINNENVIIDPKLDLSNRINCEQNTTYCFEDSHCNGICSIASSSKCSNGICINAAIINTTAPKNECNAERGVLTYFVGNPTLGRYDYLCKSIDLGIASDDITEPNKMCKNGLILINYLQQFPDANQCNCFVGFTKIPLPETSQIRTYVECISNEKIHLII